MNSSTFLNGDLKDWNLPYNTIDAAFVWNETIIVIASNYYFTLPMSKFDPGNKKFGKFQGAYPIFSEEYLSQCPDYHHTNEYMATYLNISSKQDFVLYDERRFKLLNPGFEPLEPTGPTDGPTTQIDNSPTPKKSAAGLSPLIIVIIVLGILILVTSALGLYFCLREEQPVNRNTIETIRPKNDRKVRRKKKSYESKESSVTPIKKA